MEQIDGRLFYIPSGPLYFPHSQGIVSGFVQLTNCAECVYR